jgi:RNA polymerase sigma-70 factor (ECF subfamily)
MPASSLTARERDAIFHRWLDQHLGLILKVVRGCASAAHDQDDLFQEILLQLWFSIPSFRGEAKETTWIYRVAFNTMLAWHRGERRRRERHETVAQAVAFPRVQPSHLDAAPAGHIVERLYALIHRLPKIDASLALMHLDGLSYQEMAEVLGISETYVGVKLTRLRRQLAEQWKGEKDEL